MRKTCCAGALACGLWTVCLPQAWAHGYEPFGRCAHQDAKTIRCTGGMDGRLLPGLRIDVLADDGDRILVRGRLDAQGAFAFEKPAVPFYVLIEAKPGKTVEIDDGEIK
ncbi:hypothetical protein [Shinella sp.]|uniref:hypothetical protein n=1 Tax=Shinella sp. TaxID=1870904 RepID=UPI0039E47FE4